MRHTLIVGVHNNCLKIKISARPVDGKANVAILIFIQQILGIKKNQLKLISGDKSRYKKILISNVSENIFQQFNFEVINE